MSVGILSAEAASSFEAQVVEIYRTAPGQGGAETDADIDVGHGAERARNRPGLPSPGKEILVSRVGAAAHAIEGGDETRAREGRVGRRRSLEPNVDLEGQAVDAELVSPRADLALQGDVILATWNGRNRDGE